MPVELSDEQDDPLESSQLLSLADMVLREERVDFGAMLSITFVGPEEMSDLNHRYLGKEGPTDVLSLPIEDLEPGKYRSRSKEGPPLLVGDVVICPTVVRAQADVAAVPFDDEMALMVVHGVLHLLGYDHEEETDAEQMEQRERELLALAGQEFR